MEDRQIGNQRRSPQRGRAASKVTISLERSRPAALKNSSLSGEEAKSSMLRYYRHIVPPAVMESNIL